MSGYSKILVLIMHIIEDFLVVLGYTSIYNSSKVELQDFRC